MAEQKMLSGKNDRSDNASSQNN